MNLLVDANDVLKWFHIETMCHDMMWEYRIKGQCDSKLYDILYQKAVYFNKCNFLIVYKMD